MEYKSSAVADMGDRLATIDMGRRGGCCAPFRGGGAGPHLTQCGLGPWADICLRTKWHLHPSSPLATIDVGQKVGVLYSFLGGPGSTSIPSGILINAAVWPQQTWAENWGPCPIWGGVAGFPSNTMWPGPSLTTMPSFSTAPPIHA